MQTQGWEGLAMQLPVELDCGFAFGNWRLWWGQGEGLGEDGPLGPPLCHCRVADVLLTWQPDSSGPWPVSSHWLNHSFF